MKKLVFSLLFAFALVGVCFAGDLVLPIEDQTDGPVRAKGSTVLRETRDADQLFMAYHDPIQVTNVSAKPIILLIETADVTFSNGHKMRDVKQYDAFFATAAKQIKPGETIELPDHDPNDQQFSAPARFSSVSTPSCIVRAVYVQFADGTEWGDKAEAVQAINNRELIWSNVASLAQTYKGRGEEAFVTALNTKQSERGVESYLEGLRLMYQKNGIHAVMGTISQVLQSATEASKTFRK